MTSERERRIRKVETICGIIFIAFLAVYTIGGYLYDGKIHLGGL